MDKYILFSHLKVGDTAKIIGFNKTEPAYKKKLISMGLSIGCVFKIIRKAPMGDPVQIKTISCNITLRRKEADSLTLEFIRHE